MRPILFDAASTVASAGAATEARSAGRASARAVHPCVVGTPGAELHPALAEYRFDAVFDKGEYAPAYSGFEGKDDGVGLAQWLAAHDVTDVDVVGIATDYCVRATALDAAEHGLTTRVLLDLTAAVAPARVDQVVAEFDAAGIEVA